jgi:hypothetical protein
VARLTAATANPDLLVASVVRLFEALSVTDDGQLAAERAESRESLQGNLGHPGSVWSSVSDSAIKRTTAGAKADRRPSCQAASVGRPSLSSKLSVRTKKEYYILGSSDFLQIRGIGRYKA